MWDLFKLYFIKNFDFLKLNIKKTDGETKELEDLLLQNLFRSKDYKVEEESTPFELTCGQFKIIMRELFKVQDVQLLDNLFDKICGKRYSKCKLEHFFESIVFYMNCSFELKVSLIFEVYCILRNTSEIPHECLLNFLNHLFEYYWKHYENAKRFMGRLLA